MATPVARSLFNNGRTSLSFTASLSFIRASLLRPSNATSVKGQSLLAPSGVILGQGCASLNQQVTASIFRLLGRATLLVVGEDWRGLGWKYSAVADYKLEMRRSKEFSDEDEFDHMFGKFDSDDDGDMGDFDVADLKDDDGGDDDDEDDEDPDVPRKKRK